MGILVAAQKSIVSIAMLSMVSFCFDNGIASRIDEAGKKIENIDTNGDDIAFDARKLTVFVTQYFYNGNIKELSETDFGGCDLSDAIDNIDCVCQSEADQAANDGFIDFATFNSWLSTENSSAICNILGGASMELADCRPDSFDYDGWFLPKLDSEEAAIPIFADFESPTNSLPENQISRRADGSDIDSHIFIWTGTTNDGIGFPGNTIKNCGDWFNTDETGIVGTVGPEWDTEHWTYNEDLGVIDCGQEAFFYCFQVPP